MEFDEARLEYVQLVNRIRNGIDSLIHEVEDEALHNAALRNVSLDLSMDSVPLVRFLKEAKKQADTSLSLYEY